MGRDRHQKGWITEKAGNFYGHYNRYISDPDSNQTRRRHECVVLGAKATMRKWEAKKKLEAIVEQELGPNQGIVRPNPETTFETFVNTRYLPMRLGVWRDATKETNQATISRYLIPPFGKLPLNRVSLFELQVFLNDLASTYSDSLVCRCMTLLRNIMRLAAKMKFITEDPAEDLQKPETKWSKKATIAWNQLVALLENIENVRDKCLFSIAVFCGLRRSEVFGLQWKSYDGDHFNIETTAWNGKLYDRTKTRASRAPVSIPDCLQPLIAGWRGISPDISPDALMFPTRKRKGPNKGGLGPFQSTNFMGRRIQPIAQRLGIPRNLVSFQVLRRTFATDLQSYGSVKDAQVNLRHANAATTLEIYIQPIPGSARKALNDRSRALLNSKSTPNAGVQREPSPLHPPLHKQL